MTMIARSKFVLLKLLAPPQTGNIILPETVGHPCQYGEVLSVGPDVEGVNKGDIACFFEQKTVKMPSKPGGTGEIVHLIDEEGIFATLTPQAAHVFNQLQ